MQGLPMKGLGGAPGGWRSADMLREQRDPILLKTGGNDRGGARKHARSTPRGPAGKAQAGGGKPRRPLPARAPLPGFADASAAEAPAAEAPPRQGWQAAITGTVQGLGYDLVDVERAGRGLLRITIDRLPGRVYGTPGAPDSGEFITVEDCEAVTRQLQYVLEVEGLDYARLEVSSPGLDRPLRHEADYRRFAGEAVKITLREPFEGRKHWEGVLGLGDTPESYTLQLKDDKLKTERQLGFVLAEVREARLVPVVNFKGRPARAGAPHAGTDEAAAGHSPASAPEQEERQNDR
jgi:ribosome maturation factor RimP